MEISFAILPSTSNAVEMNVAQMPNNVVMESAVLLDLLALTDYAQMSNHQIVETTFSAILPQVWSVADFNVVQMPNNAAMDFAVQLELLALTDNAQMSNHQIVETTSSATLLKVWSVVEMNAVLMLNNAAMESAV